MKIYRVVYGYFSTGDMSEGEVVVELWPEKFNTKKKAKSEINKFCKEWKKDVKNGFGEDDADDIEQMFDMTWDGDKAVSTFNCEEFRTYQIIEEEA